MEILFKTKNQKQIEAAEYWVDSETEEILYGGAKGGGKTFLGCTLIFGDALIYPETHYFIARKELNDLRKHTVPSIHEVFKKWGLDINKYASFNGQDNVFNIHNGSKVFLLSCNNVPSDPMFERFGSMQMTRGWIEEAGEIEEPAKANLWLSVGRWKNDVYKLKKKLLMTANPKKGFLKREFVDPFKKGLMPYGRKYVQAFATDNSYLPEDYIRSLKNEKDNVRRQRLWEGNWDYDEDQDSLISYDALIDTFSNTIVKDNQKYLTVDVARFGEDSTRFTFWDGLAAYRNDKRQKQSISETIQQIKDFAAIEKIPFSNILVDEDGVGGGVVDGLPGIRGFVANSSPLPTSAEVRTRFSKIENEFIPKRNFGNLKSQCGFKLAELINEHKITFQLPELRDIIVEELTASLRHKDPSSDGKLQLKPKDEVKISLGRSPDVADTFIFRAWFELRKDAMLEDPNMEKIIRLQKDRFISRKVKHSSNK